MSANGSMRIMRVNEVVEKTGMPKTTLYREIRRGIFPKPHRLTNQSVGWLESEVDDWIKRVVAGKVR